MRATPLILPVLLLGCSEYDVSSTLPPAGIANPRPLEQVTQSDKLVQVTTPEVDILWVIDNSGSMQDEQDALVANFPVFMDFFLGSGLDYQIGVVSTDMDQLSHQGKLQGLGQTLWIDQDTVNPIAAFGAMAGLGISGSATEAGIAANYTAIEVESRPGGYNEGFYRVDASFHAVVISDENDQSGTNPVSKAEFIDWLLQLKPDPDNVTFSSIVNEPNCAQCGIFGGETAGASYIDVTQAVGGILHPIHNEDWADVLEQLGVQASGLKREFFLSQLPVPGTIEVRVEENGQAFVFVEDVDWTYSASRNSVTMVEYVPSPLAEVYVDYEILGASSGE